MPNWNTVVSEMKAADSPADQIRRKYLDRLHQKTERNVIAYYSGWLEYPQEQMPGSFFSISDADKSSLMSTISGLNRSSDLDLILHTPGGGLAPTASIVDYLHRMFDDIRVIVPQLAMSAGTMIALASDRIMMGKHSSLGPIDPQINGRPAHGIIEEFNKAAELSKSNKASDVHKAKMFGYIIQNYGPALVGECQKAIKWSEELVEDWLKSKMFNGVQNQQDKVDTVIEEFGDHALTMSHDRHISIDEAKAHGLEIEDLEADQNLQDAVLSVHHAFNQTFSQSNAVKIVENHEGIAKIQSVS